MVPDLFIVGATKCATSTLHYQLGQSHHICESWPKEPRLLEDGLSLHTVKRRYRDFFNNKNCYEDPVYVDGNPNHLVIGYVPEKIELINPNAKILVVVREPVARLISHISYFKNMRPGRESGNLSFNEFNLDKFRYEADYVPYMCPEWGNYVPMYCETGCYAHYINKFAKRFETKLLVFEQYVANPQAEIDAIMDWLGKPSFKIKDFKARNVNDGERIRISRQSIQGLREFYKPYVHDLFKMTSEIPEWNY